ncbi:hypothetical protein E8E14_013202 [Neopestalotiopsis sp. 37M]|nr:hypothetical protein E8E14_013202 [Neopestalotiopsis sp. 37M]
MATHALDPVNPGVLTPAVKSTHFQLNADKNFHFEMLRVLSCATTNGADIAEVLSRCPKINSGDFETWASAWKELAERVEEQAKESDATTSSGKTSARNAFLRAATYYRTADFFLHGNPEDPRIMTWWVKHLQMFDRALAYLPYKAHRIRIEAKIEHSNFHIPTIFYSASDDKSGRKPTLIVGNGFDGSQEEMLHVIGWPALERGFNVISYEGPGQPSVRRYQNRGFIVEWEKVVTPIVDHLHKHQEELNVDVDKLGLWGHSMGGLLGLRAVAFEHRIKAFIACDGVRKLESIIPKRVITSLHEGKADQLLKDIKNGKEETGLRWVVTHGAWAMFDKDEFPKGLESSEDLEKLVKKVQQFNLDGIIEQVGCKVFVGDAADDMFFNGQPKELADALGSNATHHIFGKADDSDTHCQVGAMAVLAQKTMDWFENVVTKKSEEL